MNFRVPLGFLFILVLCAVIILEFIALANIPAIVSWCLDHKIVSFMNTIDIFVVVILLGTGVLLSMAIVVASRLEERYLEKKYYASRPPEAVGELGRLAKSLDVLNDSINHLKELSKAINEQTRIISRLGWKLQNFQS